VVKTGCFARDTLSLLSGKLAGLIKIILVYVKLTIGNKKVAAAFKRDFSIEIGNIIIYGEDDWG